MSQLPERYQAAIAPLIDKARELVARARALEDVQAEISASRASGQPLVP